MRLKGFTGKNNMPEFPRFRFCGDTGLSVELGDDIDIGINRKVHRLFHKLRLLNMSGIISMNPTYRSLFICYDPWLCSYQRLMMTVSEICKDDSEDLQDETIIEIPVCYGDEFGPDLEELAAFHGMSADEVIQHHTMPDYQVFLIGFTPGFPYLGGLDAKLYTPRKKTPRQKVPAGSVGIADRQSGIYPIDSPGGWQIIGRTPIKIFDLGRYPIFLISAGNIVRFRAITKEQFENHPH